MSELVFLVDKYFDVGAPRPDVVDGWRARLCQLGTGESRHKDGDRILRISFSNLRAASLAMLTLEPADNLLVEGKRS